MSRSILGFALLLILLLGGIFVEKEMEVRHRPVARMLEVSADSAGEGDWEEAQSLSRTAAARWNRAWSFSASFADHQPMEEIDGLFARLEVFARERDAGEFAALCRELARRVDAMADAHTLNLRNLL